MRRLQGYVDVVDVHGDIVDVKMASKKPSGMRADYRVQVAAYAMLAPGASGPCAFTDAHEEAEYSLVDSAFQGLVLSFQ